MKILVVEDEEYRCKWFREACIGHSIDFAYDAEQAKDFLTKSFYNMIFLDHDLNDSHYAAFDNSLGLDSEAAKTTGAAVAEWMLIAKNNVQAEIIVHSLNPVGSQNIYATLKIGNYNVRRVPFLELKKQLKNER